MAAIPQSGTSRTNHRPRMAAWPPDNFSPAWSAIARNAIGFFDKLKYKFLPNLSRLRAAVKWSRKLQRVTGGG
jgi:hypothetical protein